MKENFKDGKNPQDKGDSVRHGIPKKSSITTLKKIRSSSTASKRKKQLAHWQINMRKGKTNEDAAAVNTGSIPNPATTVMGKKPKEINVTDRRRKKGTTVLLKRFRTYAEDYNAASESLNENALKALRVATKAHKGQFRKSGGEYIDHPKEVARFVKQFKKSNNLSAMIQAAYLHDTLEDTDTTYADLVKQFGGLVADMVQQLTTDKKASDAIGKGEYIANKMAKMSSWALVVKLADRLANVQDIDTRPPAFQKKYAAQTRLALKRLRSDRYLSKTHNKIMTAIEKKIKEY